MSEPSRWRALVTLIAMGGCALTVRARSASQPELLGSISEPSPFPRSIGALEAVGGRALVGIAGLCSVSPNTGTFEALSGNSGHSWRQADIAIFETDDGRLWRSDGRRDGTRVIASFDSGQRVVAVSSGAEGSLVAVSDGYRERWDLWSVDSGAIGASLVFTGRAGRVIAASPFREGFGLFAVDGPSGHEELWYSDGTSAGTVEIAPFTFDWPTSDPWTLFDVLGDRRVIWNGCEIWLFVGPTRKLTRVLEPSADECFEPLPVERNDNDPVFFEGKGSLPRSRALWALRPGERQPALLRQHPVGDTSPELVRTGDRWLYFAPDAAGRQVLWRTDGTRRGTLRGVRCPGDCSTSQRWLGSSAGDQHFQLGKPETGVELWRTRGTPSSTRRLLSLGPGRSRRPLSKVLDLGHATVIAAAELESVRILAWSGDGRPKLLGRISAEPSPAGLAAGRILRVGAKALLEIEHELEGTQLWFTDGTPGGTWAVSDFPEVRLAPWFRSQGAVGEFFWFSTATSSGGSRTFAAHESLEELPFHVWLIGAPPLRLPNGQIVLRVYSSGEELWLTDGTASGTRPTQVGADALSDPFLLGDRIYVTWFDDFHGVVTRGLSSIAFDGGGHQAVGAGGRGWPLRSRVAFAGYSGLLQFDPVTGELDGELADWSVLGESTHASSSLASPDQRYLFFLGARASRKPALWVTDGTRHGTARIRDVPPEAQVRAIYEAGSRYVLQVVDSAWAQPLLGHLLQFDPTTVRVEELAPTIGESVAWDGRVMFVADDSASGRELWQSDGTARGTAQVIDLEPGREASFPEHFLVTPRGVVFSARTAEVGSELWITDGTADGTRLLVDLEPGPISSGATPRAFVEGWLYFTQESVTNGLQIWRLRLP